MRNVIMAVPMKALERTLSGDSFFNSFHDGRIQALTFDFGPDPQGLMQFGACPENESPRIFFLGGGGRQRPPLFLVNFNPLGDHIAELFVNLRLVGSVTARAA